ncbi:2-oxoglutarate carboxylase small subunit [Planctomycetes bacterium Poly30]|uniref:biotin carboxylase n=1 Tax=Saltatorellus ferox TaxID=2528018 RepID=A0A518EQU5_9BACT|nr:2-oxoglutarate carboxylase small subunit [Planctomycetes bacterium Poly30]
MFRKLCIANRGEVAVRIARAARQAGARTMCVVSSADEGAPWTEEFDETVCIGGPAPGSSYLRADAVVQAARQAGCSAVHPGWGFLAENARFAALCEQHGLTFIGPRPSIMERMGLKWPAKVAMRAAGLDLTPGSEGLLETVEEAVSVAESTGYPVILKADAGGGGRGMRICHSADEVRTEFPSARAEAISAFGNGAMFLEKYVTGGRHIEFQVIGDSYGAAVHLYERECSIQRNHQKLIEESPSPALDDATRKALGERAAQAAASIGYTGAGTIEFLMHPEGEGATAGKLCFMEMNTRLQVEHPVTEMVTGIDIVREQLRVAAAGPLGFTQQGVSLEGHAIECRINAEDPSDGFKPSPGKVDVFDIPLDQGPGRVRVDTHMTEGAEVSPYYDSLIAKVIVHAATRADAITTMENTLGAARIEGIATTIPLHLAVLGSPEFRSGQYDTRTIPGWPA